MKDLSDTLLAEQRKPERLPYVEAKVYDFEQGIKRLDWTRLYTGTEADNHHGIAFDGQGSMHRIRADGANLYRQKIASPGGASNYGSWTQIATDCAGPCAIAACGAKVYIFYRTTGNVLWKYYSHDYGATWNNAQLVAYADVLSLAACWWATGNNVVCFALKSNELNGIVLDTSTQSASQYIKKFKTDADVHIFTSTFGIGACYDALNVVCMIVLAAKETACPGNPYPYDTYNLFRTQFDATYTFAAIKSFLMAPNGEAVTYEYPDCHLPSNPQDYETIRITTAEKFSGTTAYTLPLTCHLVKDGDFLDATFTEPKPFLNIPTAYGLRLSSDSSYWWMERPDGVWRAPRAAGTPLDLTRDIVSLTQRIASPSKGEGALTITLDNSKGQYANPVARGLVPRSEVALKLGYKTTAGNEAVEVGRYWIDSWEYSSSPNASTFTLHCLDGSGLASLWSARYQMSWGQVEFPGYTVWNIIQLLLCRWGIKLWNSPAPQSSAINNFCPTIVINAGTKGDSAIARLLSFVPDGLVYEGTLAYTKDLVATEASCYLYGTSPGDHTILAGEYHDAIFPSRAQAIGRDASNVRIVQNAYDWTHLALAVDILEQDYDPNLPTTTRTQERADAILRHGSLRAQRGNLTIPANVGQQLFDVITLTDKRCGIVSKKFRVLAIQTDYNRRNGSFNQKLTIGAP